MFYFLPNLGFLVVVAAISWWLSGFDPKLTGRNFRGNFTRRFIRCAVSLLIVDVSYQALWRCQHYNDQHAGMLYFVTLVPVAFLWLRCISEALAQLFHRVVDPQQDSHKYDPKKGVRELDAVGELIRSGRKDEAIELCRTLLHTSDDNRAALEMTLAHLGVPVEPIKKSRPLAAANRLRSKGKYQKAKAILTAALKAHPENVGAALVLMRLYAQDLRDPDKAREVLESLKKQRQVSSAHLEFAKRSLEEWLQPGPEDVPAGLKPESIEELLAQRYFGTAVEILENKVEAEPGNFELWFKLAEVHGKHCANLRSAEKMVGRIEANPAFSAEQIRLARAKLREWRDAAEKQQDK